MVVSELDPRIPCCPLRSLRKLDTQHHFLVELSAQLQQKPLEVVHTRASETEVAHVSEPRSRSKGFQAGTFLAGADMGMCHLKLIRFKVHRNVVSSPASHLLYSVRDNRAVDMRVPSYRDNAFERGKHLGRSRRN